MESVMSKFIPVVWAPGHYKLSENELSNARDQLRVVEDHFQAHVETSPLQ